MTFGQHLILQELTIPPAGEQVPSFDGWLMARVAAGLGYWLPVDQAATGLNPGDGFVAWHSAAGRLRASQLEALKLQYFTLQPHDLEGLLTVVEWHRIELVRRQPHVAARFFKHSDAIGQRFARIAGLAHTEQLPLRCALLQLWAAAATELTCGGDEPAGSGTKLRARFWQLLNRMTRTELCWSAPVELARRINCSERHLRGLFRREFGVSLHAYQAALRTKFESGLPLPSEAAAEETAGAAVPAASAGETVPKPSLRNTAKTKRP